MRHGVLSEMASMHLFGNKDCKGLRVKYQPHPDRPDTIAQKVYREKDGAYIGGYVSIGANGIIDSERL